MTKKQYQTFQTRFFRDVDVNIQNIKVPCFFLVHEAGWTITIFCFQGLAFCNITTTSPPVLRLEANTAKFLVFK